MASEIRRKVLTISKPHISPSSFPQHAWFFGYVRCPHSRGYYAFHICLSGGGHAVCHQHSSVHSIHPSTALDVVRVESNFNPYAIAEIIPRGSGTFSHNKIISHQPTSRERAERIIRRLVAQSRRYSVGLMQITSTNFHHYGVTASELLDPCTNLSVFEYILNDCYRRGGSLKRALSCYYSGNFRTGEQPEAVFSGTSYLQRIGYAAASRYAVPGTHEDKLTPPSFLKLTPAGDQLRPCVIWPKGVVRGVPSKFRLKKIALEKFSTPSLRRSLSLSPREEKE